jgi:hypothetical protein
MGGTTIVQINCIVFCKMNTKNIKFLGLANKTRGACQNMTGADDEVLVK